MRIQCARPSISSYNFMRYLCAALAKNKKVVIDLQGIVKHIYDFKKKNADLQYMFEDIEFRKGIDNVVSNDIYEGINNLQTFGLAGKLNPTYEKLIIYLSEKEADEILQGCEADVKEAMMNLAEVF